jgi:ribonuclease P protein subunit RPR2
MTRRINKNRQLQIAQKRIEKLFLFAEKQAKSGNLPHAHNAVRIARNIAMRTTYKLPKKYKHQMCKHCYRFLLPSVTCQVRIRNGKKTITCFYCHNHMRYPFEDRDY